MRASCPFGITYLRPSESQRSIISIARPGPDSPFSRPYTEGFAYALLFAFLCRTPMLFARLDAKSAAEVGVWLGVCLLVRSQFFVVVAAFGVAGVAALVVDRAARRDLVVFGVVAVVGMGVTLAPYFAYLDAHTHGFTPLNYVLFNETPGDSPLSAAAPYVRPRGFAYVLHILQGVRVAWLSSRSYFSAYQFAHWALPAALLLGAFELARRPALRERLDGARAFLTQPQHRAWFFVGALAVVGFLSVHLLAKSNNRWYFDRRHNLVCLFVFFFALVALLRSPRYIARVVGAVLVFASAVVGLRDVVDLTARVWVDVPRPDKPALVSWLNAEHARLGRDFTVAFNQPQVVVWQTPGVHFHEVNVGYSTLDDVLYMADHLDAEYLISPMNRRAKHRTPPDRFAAAFVKVAVAPPFAIFRRTNASGPLVLPPLRADQRDDDDGDDDKDDPQ